MDYGYLILSLSFFVYCAVLYFKSKDKTHLNYMIFFFTTILFNIVKGNSFSVIEIFVLLLFIFLQYNTLSCIKFNELSTLNERSAIVWFSLLTGMGFISGSSFHKGSLAILLMPMILFVFKRGGIISGKKL